VKQATDGGLYLENNCVARCSRRPDLGLECWRRRRDLAGNARLYDDLREREARIPAWSNSKHHRILIWDFQGRIIDANQLFLDIVGYGREISSRVGCDGDELTPANGAMADDRALQS